MKTTTKQREAQRRWRENNPGKAKASTDRWRAENPRYKDERAAQQRAWRAANPRKVRDAKLRGQFGISLEQWEALLVSQGNRCACCGSTAPHDKRGWYTDHCHSTGKIRGLICAKCNITLGALGDCAKGVVKACARYLAYLAKSGDTP